MTVRFLMRWRAETEDFPRAACSRAIARLTLLSHLGCASYDPEQFVLYLLLVLHIRVGAEPA